MLLPALKLYGGKSSPFFLVFKDESKLHGFIPLVRSLRYGGTLFPHLRLWRYKHCFLCEPLIAAGKEQEVADALFRWWKESSGAPSGLVFNTVDRDSSFLKAVSEKLTEESLPTYEESEERAVFLLEKSFEDYENRHFSKQFQKELRRKQKRASKLGEIRYEFFKDSEVTSDWMKEFLELEAKGWKGEQGTALLNSDVDQSFLRSLLESDGPEPRIEVAGLRLERQLIAASITLSTEDTGYAFKIAYDEEKRKLSPAVLLEVEHIRHMHEQKGYSLFDTCTEGESEMAKRLGSSSRKIATIGMSKRGFPEGVLLTHLIPLLSRVREIFEKRASRK